MEYLIISLLILILSYYLFKKASGTMAFTKINMISYIFYYNLLIQSYIGGLIIFYDPSITIGGFTNQELKFYGWLAVLYVMIVMPLGMLIVKRVLAVSSVKKLFKQYTSSNILGFISNKDSYIRIPLYFFSVLCLLSIVYTFMNLGCIPLFRVFGDFGATELARFRIIASREFLGNWYVRNIFGITLTPILMYIAYAYWVTTRNFKDLIWFLIMFVLTFFILTYSTGKGPFLHFIFGFVFLTVLIKGFVKLKNLVLLFILACISIVAMYIFIMGFSDISPFLSYKTGPIGRIFIGQIKGFYEALYIFPNSHDFILGRGVSHYISSFFGVACIENSSARIVAEFMRPDDMRLGIAGVNNTLFIGDAWANFGLIGLLLAPLYVGGLIEIIYLFFLKSKKTPLLLGLFTYFSWHNYVTSDFMCYIFNRTVFALVMIIFIIFFIKKILKGVVNYNT